MRTKQQIQNKSKLWIVLIRTQLGTTVSYTDKNNKVWAFVSKDLGYTPAFKNKKQALNFARKARKLKAISHAEIREITIV